MRNLKQDQRSAGDWHPIGVGGVCIKIHIPSSEDLAYFGATEHLAQGGGRKSGLFGGFANEGGNWV